MNYQYTHDKITVNIEQWNTDWADHKGDTAMSLPVDKFVDLYENSCSFYEFVQYDLEGTDLVDLDRDERTVEVIKAFLENKGLEVFRVSNPDAIISVYEYYLEEDNEVVLDIETEHASWVVHDMQHAVHDAAGCTIYVKAAIERERILFSMDYTKKHWPDNMPGVEWLEEMEDDFQQRFKQPLDLEEYKYFGYEEE